jgi:hypothetical protein
LGAEFLPTSLTISPLGDLQPVDTADLKNGADAPTSQLADGATETSKFQNGPLFEREDWTQFRSLDTLPQKAGVPLTDLPRLVLKELTDNALDATGQCRAGLLEGENGFFVEDDGPGIPGSDSEVARLFSVRRPLATSKLIRLPTRGTLGNGLRVVAGVVLATGGTITVATRGRRLRLTPRDDGGTDYKVVGPAPAAGTRVEVRLGSPFEVDEDDLSLAEFAIGMAEAEGPRYKGKTSPHWYDPDSFWELCQAGGDRTVRGLVAEFFDGCSEPAAGKITAAGSRGKLARDLSRPEARQVLAAAKGRAKPVNTTRLGYVGREAVESVAYAKTTGKWTITTGVQLPIVIEAWVNPVETEDDVNYMVCVNRTPIASETWTWIKKEGASRTLILGGCDAQMRVKIGRVPLKVVVNVDTPFMPITTDGKTPDLSGLSDVIERVAAKAANRARKGTREPERPTQKALIIDAIPGGAAKMSGGGELRYSQRQLFYAVREQVKRQMPAGPDGEPFELDWGYFCNVVTDYEAEYGDIPGMYRDPRGTLYHPHTGEEIPLGTIAVENYDPPRWTFNKLLYCEKEGFIEIMKSVGWPERNDCALVSSKGFASRAVRDVFDLLGETDQDIKFFCVHDADAYGTMIYQSLKEATRARGARKVEVIDLGLNPDEALEMGLEPEPITGDKLKPVADYVEPEWRDWLQGHRVELNAMPTRQFLDWLDAKLTPHAGKVVPPPDVLTGRLAEGVEAKVRERVTVRVLAEAGLDDLVARSVAERAPAVEAAGGTIARDVTRALRKNPHEPWSAPVERIAERIAKAEVGRRRSGPRSSGRRQAPTDRP